ncbi:Leucine-rich repeat and coiled-coil domain-containing protein 1 [Oryzias melastigma]|uniref:Leucine-rich repeat and coiled-coil domain-containing protein 1 n=1 Tax=Oryzias melastigma TaxID=30732 RepID=A0A3B3DGK2_ORYME|nr:leucine-rich repeat and coiled-coil domain-containing protein 1 [Oryzias melastigma]KAF6733971.1 Leucine-rich repeat and coiled-coil domain-containing protein 1 [Oryzias melastigma]
MEDRELNLANKELTSLLDVPLGSVVTSLNLHCNHIPRIEGLTSSWNLRYLNLSSNRISRIEGLSSLSSLRTLNLSCNLITKVEGLNGLVNLTRLNLSCNQINNLTGLLYLHGTGYKLKHLSLHGNHLDSIDHLLQCLLGLQGLRNVTLKEDGHSNPLCVSAGYWDTVMESLPQIFVLDGLDRLRHPSSPGLSSICDIAGLEDYMDLLLSSDTSHHETVKGAASTPRSAAGTHISSEEVAPPTSQPVGRPSQPVSSTAADQADPDNEERIRKLEQQVSRLIQQVPAGEKPPNLSRNGVKLLKAKRDTDRTSESDGDSSKENRRRSRIPTHPAVLTSSTTTQETRSSSEQANRRMRALKSAGSRRKAGSAGRTGAAVQPKEVPLRAAKDPGDVRSRSIQEEETYRTIVEERDQERERRWKAEQAVRRLAEELKSLQTRVSEEKDLQSMALHTTDRLKDLLLKERSGRSELQNRVEELEGRLLSLTQQLELTRSSEEKVRVALQRLEESTSHGDALRARQQAEEMKRQQELENKAAALKRELDIQRAAVQQHKDKLQQLHELLASREHEHRKQLELRLTPGGADFREAVAQQVSSAERSHAQREAELQEKLAEGRRQYAALEDEFHMALTIEAARFSEVKEAYDRLTEEVVEVRAALSQSQQKEKKFGSLVQELTAVVKEQKNRIAEIVRTKREAVGGLRSRLRSLEEELEGDRRLGVQLELLQKEKARLLSEVTAQQSVIDGLRSERRIWGQELAQQGASLAQDRGRLEARIEVLTSELETQRKRADGDLDALKIKTKILDDQTETIRKLKESLQERDDQIRRLKDEAADAQRRFHLQLEEDGVQQAELKERLERLSLRKEELKQQLEDKEAELHQVTASYRDSSRRWQEKEELLSQLEVQVKRMKENFDSKERHLLEETEKATEAHKAALQKLRHVDDTFRAQLESVHAAHQAELLQLESKKQQEVEQANQKVLEVEEEMRQLLQETQTSKRAMEEKVRRLSSVLKDFHS